MSESRNRAAKPTREPPPLAFGQRIAQTDRSVRAMQDRMAAEQGWVAEYDPIGAAEQFLNRKASVAINGLKMAAVAHTPIRTRAIANASCSIFVPVAGAGNNSVVNGLSLSFEPGQNALFAPEGERIGRGGHRSLLIIDVDPGRLRSTTAAMLGDDEDIQGGFDFTLPQALPLRMGGVALDDVLGRLCAVVDQFCAAPRNLDNLALDESFYRVMAMLLQPARLLDPHSAEAVRGTASRAVDLACQYAIAHLDHALTLTDLERVSGLSRRALQYGFLKAFGVTPMQWVREQRYLLAHRRLAAAGPGETVTSIALACKFLSPSQFSLEYRRRFGVLPSRTLAGSRGR